MADIDPFGEHESRTDEQTDENIPMESVTPGGGSTWEPEREQETPFGGGGMRLRTKVLKERVNGLYEKLARHFNQIPVYHYDVMFEIKDGALYVRGTNIRLTKTDGELRTAGELERKLGVIRLSKMGFKVPKGVTTRQAAMLNKTEEELPSASAINRADEIEMKELTEKVISSNEDLIREISSDRGTQTGEDDPEMPTMRELVGLDKELRSIRGSLKVEAAKKVEFEQHIEREKTKLSRIVNDPEYDDGIRDDIRNRIKRLNEDLKVRQESIDVLKGRLKNQITSFRETIAKVLDKDATLGERIRTLFREQGITIFSILTAIGMAIGVLVEALVPGSTATTIKDSHGGDTPGSAKEWIRNKLKALASLLGKLAEKAAAALPGIIGSVVAWLLNHAKEVVGWISKNLWSLVLLCIWMVYDYMKKK